MLTDKQLAAIRNRLNAATPGPWQWADWGKTNPNEPDDLSRNATLEHIYPNEGPIDILPFDGRSPWMEDGLADTFVRYRPNADLIAHVPEDLVALLEDYAAMRKVVEAVSKRGVHYRLDNGRRCYFCEAETDMFTGEPPHEPGCPVLNSHILLKKEINGAIP